jgi:hypothetical protein
MKSISLLVLFAFLIGCVFFGKSTTSAPKTVTVQKPVYIERRIEVPVRVEAEKRVKVPARAKKVAKKATIPVEKNVEVQTEQRVLVQVPAPPPPVMSAPVYTAIPQPIQVPQGTPTSITPFVQYRPQVVYAYGGQFANVNHGINGPWTGARCGMPRGMVRTHR